MHEIKWQLNIDRTNKLEILKYIDVRTDTLTYQIRINAIRYIYIEREIHTFTYFYVILTR